MACPVCQRPSNSTPNGAEGISRSHDVSNVNAHIATPDWLQQVSNAIKAAWPERFLGYSRVAVLMLSWENGDITNQSVEFKRLEKVFRLEFRYEVHEWQIPLKKSGKKLVAKVQDFVEAYDEPTSLLIIYYAGHARRGDRNGSYPVWFPSKGKDKPEANTAFFSSLLTANEEDSPDVLTLYDCCHPLCTDHPSSPPTRAVIESLCAGGFESEVPLPGPDSFTWALVDELSLAASSKDPVSIPELHKNLICNLGRSFQKRAQWNPDGSRRVQNGTPIFTKDYRRTPVYMTLSANEPRRTIMLTPMPQTQGMDTRSLQPNNTSKSSNQNSPSVLLIVRVLEDEVYVKDKVKNWLMNSPAGVVEFKGFYHSYSTLILVKVAFEVWDLLPPCHAVSFAGFAVTAPAATPFSMPKGPSIGSITMEEGTSTPTGSGPVPFVRDTSGLLKGENIQMPSILLSEPEQPPGLEAQQQTLFIPRPDLDIVTKLLDFVDNLPRETISMWKVDHCKFKIEDSLSKALFTEFSRSLVLDNEPSSTAFGQALISHEELLSQYLIVRELVQSNDPYLDIHRRLKYMLLYQFDEEASVNYPEESVPDMSSVSGTHQPSIWSGASSKTSKTGYEPSIDIPAVTVQHRSTQKPLDSRGRSAQPPEDNSKSGVTAPKEGRYNTSIEPVSPYDAEGTFQGSKVQVITNKIEESLKHKTVLPETKSAQLDKIPNSKHRSNRKNTTTSPIEVRIGEKVNAQIPKTDLQEQSYKHLPNINKNPNEGLDINATRDEQRPLKTGLAQQGNLFENHQNNTPMPLSTQAADQNTKSSVTRSAGPGIEHKDKGKGKAVAFSSKVENIQPNGLESSNTEDDTVDQEFVDALIQSQDGTFYSETRTEDYPFQSQTPGYSNMEAEFDLTRPSMSSHKVSTQLPSVSDEISESFDTHFRVYPSSQYELGNVFKVVWAEPGRPTDGVNSFITGVRRFIIVATDHSSSVCVPILTYEGRGCTKKGTRPQNHAIVYTPPKTPRLVKGEHEMGFDPIRIEMFAAGETLYCESRVNLSKLVTIEHNVETVFIGYVYPEDMKIVRIAVETCWNRRTRSPATPPNRKHGHSRK